MKKLDRFLAILYLIICSIVIIGLIFFSKNLFDRVFVGIVIVFWGLALTRSYHLENYLRQVDTKKKMSFFEHFTGVLNNWKKIVGLVIIIRPVFDKNEFIIERKRINLLTALLYIVLLGLIIFLIMFDK